MKLMLIIINEEDREEVSDALAKENFRATMVSTTGEFLQYGNTTYLLGVDDHETNRVLEILRDNTTIRLDEVLFSSAQDYEHSRTGRATVFTLDVMQYVQQNKGGIINVKKEDACTRF